MKIFWSLVIVTFGFFGCKNDDQTVDVRTEGERGSSDEDVVSRADRNEPSIVMYSAIKSQADIVMSDIMSGDESAVDKWHQLESNSLALNVYRPTRPTGTGGGTVTGNNTGTGRPTASGAAVGNTTPTGTGRPANTGGGTVTGSSTGGGNSTGTGGGTITGTGTGAGTGGGTGGGTITGTGTGAGTGGGTGGGGMCSAYPSCDMSKNVTNPDGSMSNADCKEGLYCLDQPGCPCRPHCWGTPKPRCPPELVAAEMAALQRILAQAYAILQADPDMGGLSCGWIGNLFRCGPECDQVANKFGPIVDRLMAAEKAKPDGVKFKCVEFVGLFDSGCLPCDLAAHVFFGIKIDGKLVYYIDPWRHPDANPRPIGQCTNSPDDPGSIGK